MPAALQATRRHPLYTQRRAVYRQGDRSNGRSGIVREDLIHVRSFFAHARTAHGAVTDRLGPKLQRVQREGVSVSGMRSEPHRLHGMARATHRFGDILLTRRSAMRFWLPALVAIAVRGTPSFLALLRRFQAGVHIGLDYRASLQQPARRADRRGDGAGWPHRPVGVRRAATQCVSVSGSEGLQGEAEARDRHVDLGMAGEGPAGSGVQRPRDYVR